MALLMPVSEVGLATSSATTASPLVISSTWGRFDELDLDAIYGQHFKLNL
jgi:hypothetical protein